MPRYNSPRGGTTRTVPNIFVFFYVLLLFFLSFCVLFVCKRVLYYCQRVLTQLQLTNMSYHIISNHIISYHIISYQTELTFQKLCIKDVLRNLPIRNEIFIHHVPKQFCWKFISCSNVNMGNISKGEGS
jgi:hypothetical protein